jgi:hypothetical protein
MIGDVIYSLLSNDATVSGIVGVKIFPSIALQEIALPYIVYEESNNQPTNTKDGKSELDVVSYDIEIYAENPSDLSSLSYAVRNCLDRYTGIIGGKRIDSVKYVSENSGYSLEDRVYLRVHNYDFRYFPLVQTLRQPTNLVATGNTSDITLTWVDNATGESGYKVYRGTSLYDLDLLATIAANLQTYVDSTPLANTIYYYYVVPYSSLGNGYASNVVAQKLGNVTEITFTFDNNLIAVVDTSPYNIDCDTPIQVVIISGIGEDDGTYPQTGDFNSKPIYNFGVTSVYYTGTQWVIVGHDIELAEEGDEDYPWLATWNTATVTQGTISDYCGGDVCADATVNVNGNLFDTVVSGGTLDVPVEYENGTPVGTIVSGVVQVPNPIVPSGIAYIRPQPTGQPSTVTGDESWIYANDPFSPPPANPIHVAELADFFTLKNNNVFGNTDRFTALDGTQSYVNNYMICNHMGIGVYTAIQGAATFLEALAAAESSTLLGYTNWHVTPIATLFKLANLSENVRPLAYAPLSRNVNTTILTSTHDERNALNAFNLSNALGNLILTGAKSSTTFFYYLYRNHY